MSQIKWLLTFMDRKYRVAHAVAMAISVVTSIMLLVNPALTARLMDDVIIAGNPDPLMGILITMLVVRIVRESMRYLMIVLLEKAGQNTMKNMRKRLFRRIQFQDTRFYDAHRTGDLMTRMSSDMDWCRHFLSYIDYVLVDSATTFLATSIYLFFVSWRLALALVAVTPLLLLISFFFSRRARPMFRDMRDKLSDMNTDAQENIAGNRVVKAFAREDFEAEKFDTKSRAFRDANLSINKLWLTFFPLIEILTNAMTVITIFLGGWMLMQTPALGGLTPGKLTIFSSLTWALSVPMRNLGNILNDWQRFSTSAGKVMELDLAKPDIQDAACAQDHDRVKGEIEFRSVSFSYDTTPVLEDISFHAASGETIAIMGPTGSGKSTIIQLLARCYDIQKGEILVDGCNVRKWKLQQLRGGIGMATQDVFLFSDTVEGNIAFGDQDLSMEEVERYAHAAAADGFIPDLPDGYDTIVGERGVGLSGGQKQRIALARALAVKPGILVMDDTTSAVDMETEKLIQSELRALPYECTKIIIAQRISSVKDADQILIIRDGRIAERGTHEELLAKKGYYYETWCLQNGMEPEDGEVA